MNPNLPDAESEQESLACKQNGTVVMIFYTRKRIIINKEFQKLDISYI